MPQKIRTSSLFTAAEPRTHGTEHRTLYQFSALDHSSTRASLNVEGKSIAYKLGKSDRCAKSEFEFSRTFNFFGYLELSLQMAIWPSK